MTQNIKTNINDHKIEIIRNMIDVTRIKEPDPNWAKKCECGVIHKWTCFDEKWPESPGLCSPILPNLIWVVDSPGSDDSPEIGHYECSNCSQEISPAYRTPIGNYYIPGRISIFINDQPATKNDLLNLLKKQGVDISNFNSFFND